MIKSPPANAGDIRNGDSVSESGRFTAPEFCHENSTDREPWQAVVRGVAKSQTGLGE